MKDTHSAIEVAPFCLFGLKGPHMSAQGNALGLEVPITEKSPERAKQNLRANSCHALSGLVCKVHFATQGVALG
jgi:hypothetical protein